jgi:MerR family copper efflux transcriptional regulator
METISIGTLARQAGVNIDTVRYYERSGLLPEPPRRPSGYRVYPLTAVRRLRFIRRAKDLGFTLEEISGLLALSGRRDVKAVKKAAQKTLDRVELKIAELERIRAGLSTLIDACPGHGRADDCPILAALNEDDAS